MKRLLPGLCCVLLLSAIGPVPSASAHWWSFHRHHKDAASSASEPTPAPAPAPAPKPKAKRSWFHHEHQQQPVAQNGVTTTPGPRSVGWWHKTPGPAGAGAN